LALHSGNAFVVNLKANHQSTAVPSPNKGAGELPAPVSANLRAAIVVSGDSRAATVAIIATPNKHDFTKKLFDTQPLLTATGPSFEESMVQLVNVAKAESVF